MATMSTDWQEVRVTCQHCAGVVTWHRRWGETRVSPDGHGLRSEPTEWRLIEGTPCLCAQLAEEARMEAEVAERAAAHEARLAEMIAGEDASGVALLGDDWEAVSPASWQATHPAGTIYRRIGANVAAIHAGRVISARAAADAV